MAWTTKSKDISITSTTDHPSSQAGVIAAPPGVSTISFTPAEFFGAAARCCHLHVINPLLVTPESAMVKALVEQYVDDQKTDFAIVCGCLSNGRGPRVRRAAARRVCRDGVWADRRVPR